MKTALFLLALVAFAGVARAADRKLLSDDDKEDKKKTIQAYKQCGGKNNCGKGDKGKQCDGEAWEGYECEKGFKCDRQNQWYWQCMPRENANRNSRVQSTVEEPTKLGPNEIARYQQCGGSSGACDKYGCMDCAFPGMKCEKDFLCNRKSDSYWQCDPEDEVKNKNVKYCPPAPKLVKVIKDEDQDYDVEDLIKNQDAPAAKKEEKKEEDKAEEKPEEETPAPPQEPEEPGFDTAADVDTILGETKATKTCNTPVLEHEIDGRYIGGVYLEGATDMYGACCDACLKEAGCAGFQVNLYANATTTCDMFAEVLDVVPSTSVTAGVILMPNEVSIAGRK